MMTTAAAAAAVLLPSFVLVFIVVVSFLGLQAGCVARPSRAAAARALSRAAPLFAGCKRFIPPQFSAGGRCCCRTQAPLIAGQVAQCVSACASVRARVPSPCRVATHSGTIRPSRLGAAAAASPALASVVARRPLPPIQARPPFFVYHHQPEATLTLVFVVARSGTRLCMPPTPDPALKRSFPPSEPRVRTSQLLPVCIICSSAQVPLRASPQPVLM